MRQRIYLIVLLSIFSMSTQAGIIRLGEGFSTIDYRFFTFNLDAVPIPDGENFSPDFRSNFSRIEAYAPPSDTYAGPNPDGIINPDLDLNIYIDDGTFSNTVYQNNGLQETGGSIAASVNNFVVYNRGANIDASDTTPHFFFDTNYVAVIGTHSLAIGQPRPFHQHSIIQNHANERIDTLDFINYEFNISTDLGGGAGIFTSDCTISGNLDGSYTHPCSLSRLGLEDESNQSVPAPASIWNLLLGIAGLLLINFRKKNTQINPDLQVRVSPR